MKNERPNATNLGSETTTEIHPDINPITTTTTTSSSSISSTLTTPPTITSNINVINHIDTDNPTFTNDNIGTFPPEWLPDHDANSCMSCDSLFTLIKRRHHCRSCGKIFCSDCCRQKARLLYLANKEARVCNNCFYIIECSPYVTPNVDNTSQPVIRSSDQLMNPTTSRASNHNPESSLRSDNRVPGVLKTTCDQSSNDSGSDCNRMLINNSRSSQQVISKQVMFSDGIRPGTDLSEGYSNPISPSSSNNNSISSNFLILTRQSKSSNSSKSRNSCKSSGPSHITVCDELGYLPPIVLAKSSTLSSNIDLKSISTNLTSACSSSTPDANLYNCLIGFDQVIELIGSEGIITFMLLKDFYLQVKIVKAHKNQDGLSNFQSNQIEDQSSNETDMDEFWCFASDGLSRFGQKEIVLVLDRDKGDSYIPRDVFKIYLTIHELALRRQSLENLGNLLFQDGLFNNKDTAGLLLVRHMECQDVKNLVLPNTGFLFALLLQRWEVPWSKVFPVRLLLRLGHKLGHYPYPLISYRTRAPVYYEVGHTIISILGDFRNFRYSITHVEGLKVMIIKSEKRVLIQLNQSCYQQFNKVLDISTNEHVLAWSSYPFNEAFGHLVSVQNDDGQYETVEFYKNVPQNMISFESLDFSEVLGASFVIFSGALKTNQSGQPAKISIVEDGLLIQLQSCTMSALKQSIHCMHQFEIDCGNSQDILNRVNICWLPNEEEP